MDLGYTARGFAIDRFQDANGVACSLQASSAWRDEPLVWLGCDDIGLKVFRPGNGGWADVTPEQLGGNCMTANTRMHLTQGQVMDLLPALIQFATNGTLPERTESETEEIQAP